MSKKISITLLAVLMATSTLLMGGCAEKESPDQAAKSFFDQWLLYEGNPLVDQLYRDNPSLTEDYIKKVDQTLASFDKSGFDPILCAQDKPTAINIVNTTSKEDEAIVTMEEEFSGGNRLIETLMVLRDASWKIDDIICQEGERAGNDLNASVSPAIQNQVGDYIRENIENLSPEAAILGGTFYVTEIRFTGPDTAVVDYEDGHIALTADVSFQVQNAETVEITSFEIKKNTQTPEAQAIDFEETGNLTKQEEEWVLVYEKPGQPALTKTLIFDKESKCMDETPEKSCLPPYWQIGDRAEIKGRENGKTVTVRTLRIIGEASATIEG